MLPWTTTCHGRTSFHFGCFHSASRFFLVSRWHEDFVVLPKQNSFLRWNVVEVERCHASFSLEHLQFPVFRHFCRLSFCFGFFFPRGGTKPFFFRDAERCFAASDWLPKQNGLVSGRQPWVFSLRGRTHSRSRTVAGRKASGTSPSTTLYYKNRNRKPREPAPVLVCTTRTGTGSRTREAAPVLVCTTRTGTGSRPREPAPVLLCTTRTGTGSRPRELATVLLCTRRTGTGSQPAGIPGNQPQY